MFTSCHFISNLSLQLCLRSDVAGNTVCVCVCVVCVCKVHMTHLILQVPPHTLSTHLECQQLDWSSVAVVR